MLQHTANTLQHTQVGEFVATVNGSVRWNTCASDCWSSNEDIYNTTTQEMRKKIISESEFSTSNVALQLSASKKWQKISSVTARRMAAAHDEDPAVMSGGGKVYDVYVLYMNMCTYTQV